MRVLLYRTGRRSHLQPTFRCVGCGHHCCGCRDCTPFEQRYGSFYARHSSFRRRAKVERQKICPGGHPSGTTSNTQVCTRTRKVGQRHGGSCRVNLLMSGKAPELERTASGETSVAGVHGEQATNMIKIQWSVSAHSEDEHNHDWCSRDKFD